LCDVYEGALTTVTFFFATVPKLIIFNVILTLLFSVFLFENFYWSIFCQISGALSIALASIAALFQKKTKRLIAYSAVSNSGFVLLSLSCFSILSLKASFFYLMVYVFTNFSVFAVIIITTKAHILKYLINWSDFFNRNAAAGATFAIMLFSLSGIPPLAGFYSKFLIIVAVVYQSKNLIALFIALFSCIACYYYIRLVKIIFFCKSNFGVWVKVQYRTVELGTASFSTALVILLIHSDFLILFSNMFATSFF
jgi:NADH-quinone oxidoreductase subunit N